MRLTGGMQSSPTFTMSSRCLAASTLGIPLSPVSSWASVRVSAQPGSVDTDIPDRHPAQWGSGSSDQTVASAISHAFVRRQLRTLVLKLQPLNLAPMAANSAHLQFVTGVGQHPLCLFRAICGWKAKAETSPPWNSSRRVRIDGGCHPPTSPSFAMPLQGHPAVYAEQRVQEPPKFSRKAARVGLSHSDSWREWR